MRTRQEILMDILRCDREIEHCIQCQAHSDDPLGGFRGEMDWRCTRLGYEEEIDALGKLLEQAA